MNDDNGHGHGDADVIQIIIIQHKKNTQQSKA